MFSGCRVSVWEDEKILEMMVVMAVQHVNMLTAPDLHTRRWVK